MSPWSQAGEGNALPFPFHYGGTQRPKNDLLLDLPAGLSAQGSEETRRGTEFQKLAWSCLYFAISHRVGSLRLHHFKQRREDKMQRQKRKQVEGSKTGLVRDLNPGPLAP